MYGRNVDKSLWTPFRSVIGKIESTESGNVVLRVGRENDTGWSQTEHVVLQPGECGKFVNEIVQAMPHGHANTIGFRFDRELAVAVIRAFDGAEFDNQALTSFRHQLLNFVNSEPK